MAKQHSKGISPCIVGCCSHHGAVFDSALATTLYLALSAPHDKFPLPSITLERLVALMTLTSPFSSTAFLLLKGQFAAEGSPPSREVEQGTNRDSTDPALDDVIRGTHRKIVSHT